MKLRTDFNQDSTPQELGFFIGNEIVGIFKGSENEFFFLDESEEEVFVPMIVDVEDYQKFYLILSGEPPYTRSLESAILRYIYRYGFFKILFSDRVQRELIELEDDWIDEYLTQDFFESTDTDWLEARKRFNLCAGAAFRQIFINTDIAGPPLPCPELQYLKDKGGKREDFNERSTPEELGRFIGEEIVRIALGVDDGDFLLYSDSCIVDVYDLRGFELDRISGPYCGSVESLIQRFLYQYGFFKYIFNQNALSFLEIHKDTWYDALLYLDEEDDCESEKMMAAFQACLNHAAKVIHTYLRMNNLIQKNDLPDWEMFEYKQDCDD